MGFGFVIIHCTKESRMDFSILLSFVQANRRRTPPIRRIGLFCACCADGLMFFGRKTGFVSPVSRHLTWRAETISNAEVFRPPHLPPSLANARFALPQAPKFPAPLVLSPSSSAEARFAVAQTLKFPARNASHLPWLGVSLAAAFCDGFNAVSALQILRS